MRIAIAGTGSLGQRLMKALLESRHEIVALVRNGRKVSWYQKHLYPPLARLLLPRFTLLGMAGTHGIPLVYIDKMTEEELAPLRALEPDLLLVGGFGIILKEPILRLPRIGCLNTHSALLPRHRGPNPFTAVILANDKETGVTFHIIDPGIDTGDIVEQVRMPIKPRATAGLVYRETSRLAGEHVLRVIERIEREGLRGTPQDEAVATYDQKVKPEETFIHWEQSAEEIDRLIRAGAPFHVARFVFRGRPVYVYNSQFDNTPVDSPPGTVLEQKGRVKVATGRGTVVLQSTYTLHPIPWRWPSLLSRPRVGERLE